MKLDLRLFWLLLIVISCKEPKKYVVYKKPSFDSIGKMPYEKAIFVYGKPFEGGWCI